MTSTLRSDIIFGQKPKVLKTVPKAGAQWTVYHGLFSRAGFTLATQMLTQETGATLLDLDR
ncbi:hypothetical protein ANRL2_02122 [Anaerolineae bacterium]|nr:hypothetical protein ANRL2_02122 [Anaerolineae bacterium]